MKIVEIREKTVPISSPIRNAYIDFSKMTLSLVAVVTDVVRNGQIVNLDITLEKNGYIADSSTTYLVGEVDYAARRLVQTA
ncbi:M24 family metallopeptidase, partial [Klebsiella pneumoniae]|uniref:M24 family metallopeptidase n=1 Tax=Klebsiella pneumoniae TaxID=573 RepID=UPI0015F9EFBA|nr:M24 family metallopeptidase [Klebsiella pneumoniae]